MTLEELQACWQGALYACIGPAGRTLCWRGRAVAETEVRLFGQMILQQAHRLFDKK